MADFDSTSYGGLSGVDFDPRYSQYDYLSRASYPIPLMSDMSPRGALKQSSSPLHASSHAFPSTTSYQPQPTMRDWQIAQGVPQTIGYPMDHSTFQQQYTDQYTVPLQTSPTDFIQTHLETTFPMEGSSYIPMPGQADALSFNWQDVQSDLIGFPTAHGLPDMGLQQHLPESSPADTYLEVRSLTSSSSDNGWTSVDPSRQSFDSFQDPQFGAIFNPSQTLHNRTFSDSSYSDVEMQSRHSWGSFVEVPNALHSPEADSYGEMDFRHEHVHQYENQQANFSPPMLSTAATAKPIAIKTSPSSQSSPISHTRSSPPTRKQLKKSLPTKTTKPAVRKSPQMARNETEKRVGRRKGPLRPEQRKQACEIRKLGACLRCKFLKKTCDKGEPCGGCQPLHARLWQVPCTRIDIKDIAYFMKDWKADHERHVSLGLTGSGNIKGFSDTERTLFITHGYGHVLPVRARETFVRDERCFGMDWIEMVRDQPYQHAVNTAKLSAGMEGISSALLSDYLDRHIDGGFEKFIDEYFEGTPFITQMLKTTYRFWLREKTPIIRKALKLVLAYNLTYQITMVEGIPDEECFVGKITDHTSKWRGKTVAPILINFQVKSAMANMWRELQKDVLEELSTLYSSVYTRDKLKHWPTIFLLACILLTVWEEMQFDSHFGVTDSTIASKFCHDMESTPVGVIVGLFSAISQKLPSFNEWDSMKHHQLLNSNPAVCEAMTEVRDHVTRFDGYLRSRSRCAFDRDNFDSLSNKFTSKLVIKAH